MTEFENTTAPAAPTTVNPTLIRGVVLGERRHGGPAEVVVALAGGSTLMTDAGYAVTPGTYLHRDDVAAALEAQADSFGDGSTEGAEALRNAAALIRARVV